MKRQKGFASLDLSVSLTFYTLASLSLVIGLYHEGSRRVEAARITERIYQINEAAIAFQQKMRITDDDWCLSTIRRPTMNRMKEHGFLSDEFDTGDYRVETISKSNGKYEVLSYNEVSYHFLDEEERNRLLPYLNYSRVDSNYNAFWTFPVQNTVDYSRIDSRGCYQ